MSWTRICFRVVSGTRACGTRRAGKLPWSAGHKVRYVLAAKLVNELIEATDTPVTEVARTALR
jgi:hypothetical protein